MNKDNYFIRTLPFMFKDWREYRDYLLENLIQEEEWKEKFRAKFLEHDTLLAPYPKQLETTAKIHVQAIMTNDWEFVKIGNHERSVLDLYKKNLKKRAKQKAYEDDGGVEDPV